MTQYEELVLKHMMLQSTALCHILTTNVASPKEFERLHAFATDINECVDKLNGETKDFILNNK